MARAFDYRELDEVIHSRPRLGIMSILAAADEVEFAYLKERLGLTDGNLGAHLRKLEDAGYLTARKEFVDRRPRTTYAITEKGRQALDSYVMALERLIKGME